MLLPRARPSHNQTPSRLCTIIASSAIESTAASTSSECKFLHTAINRTRTYNPRRIQPNVKSDLLCSPSI